MAKRLYVVDQKTHTEAPTHGHVLVEAKPRLIRASTPGNALKFATAGFYEVDKATPEAVATLVMGGVKIEDAIEE